MIEAKGLAPFSSPEWRRRPPEIGKSSPGRKGPQTSKTKSQSVRMRNLSMWAGLSSPLQARSALLGALFSGHLGQTHWTLFTANCSRVIQLQHNPLHYFLFGPCRSAPTLRCPIRQGSRNLQLLSSLMIRQPIKTLKCSMLVPRVVGLRGSWPRAPKSNRISDSPYRSLKDGYSLRSLVALYSSGSRGCSLRNNTSLLRE